MRKNIIFAFLIILSSLLGCANQASPLNPQSSQQVQATSDIVVSTGAEPEVSTMTTSKQPIEETPASNNAHESATVSNESNNDVVETSDIDFTKPGVYEVTCDIRYNIDANMDGTLDSLTINQFWDEASGEKVSITVNGNDYSFEQHISALESYIIRKDNGKIGLLLSNNGSDTCYYTCIYTFDGVELVMKEDVSFGTESLTTNSLTLAGPVNILGTWDASNNCALNDDFTLTYSDDGLFKIYLDVNRFLATKKDISVQMLEEGEYFDTILPAYSKIYPTYAGYLDNQGCLIFETEEGLTGRLFADELRINGIGENDIFDNIIYVGA